MESRVAIFPGMGINIFLSFDGDHIGRMVGQARLSDDVEEVRRIDHAIKKGNDVFRSWATSNGGSIVEVAGDEGTIEIPADILEDLPSICHTYKTAVGATVSVGLGKTLSESAKSLMAAKFRGGCRVVFYGPDVEAEIAKHKEPTEDEKIKEAYLNKAEGSAQISPEAIGGSPHENSEHTEGSTARAVAEQGEDFESSFHLAASHQEKKDRAKEMQQGEDFNQLKQNVATSLEALRQQLPVLNQLKSAYPDSYKAVTALVQSVIGLSRGIQAADLKLENVQKSERPRLGDIHPRTQEPFVLDSGHDYSHLLPKEFQSQGYGLHVKMKSSSDDVKDQFLASTVTLPNGKPGGRVVGYFSGRSMEPHSGLDKNLQGKGIGKAMYEGLYAHAKNHHGVSTVKGEGASAQAYNVHLSLAKKYGFKIKAQSDEEIGADVPYEYSYKSELQKFEDLGLRQVSPEEFMSAMAPSLQNGNLTAHPAEKYQRAKHTVLSADGLSGYAIFHDGEFGSLFSRAKGRGDALVSHATQLHPEAHLNAFDNPHLVGLYAKHGAVETHREKNWTPGGPDIVHMKFGGLQKAGKNWIEDTGGFGNPLKIPASSNPARPEWDSQFLQGIKERFPQVDIKALKDIDLNRIVGGNSRGAVNKDRLKLYSKIAGADKLPPVVVRSRGDSYELIDGTHRAEAARSKKLKTIPAVIFRDLGKEQLQDQDPLDQLHPVFFHHEGLAKGAMARLHPYNPVAVAGKRVEVPNSYFGIPEYNHPDVTTSSPGNVSVSKLVEEKIGGANNHNSREVLGQTDISEAARQRGLHKLHSITEVRRNPNTQKREFALCRGYGKAEKYLHSEGQSQTTSHSSWTPHQAIAARFGRDWEGGHVKAWIPEDSIKQVLLQLPNLENYPRKTPSSLQSEEHEIIVAPGKYEHVPIIPWKKSEEDLDKASFKDIKSQNSAIKPEAPDGPRSQFFDYSHLLPPAYQKTHTLEVFHSKEAPSYMKRGRLIATLRSKTNPGFPAHGVPVPGLKEPEMGYVDLSDINSNGNGVEGLVHGILGEEVPRQKTMTPHSYLKPKHHGKGVGRAMYEALYARALSQGINQIAGGVHSPQASKVHESLAKKYGFKMDPPRSVFGDSMSSYKYTIKDEVQDFHLEPHPDNDPVFVMSELEPQDPVAESQDLDKVALDSAHAKKNLKLPPGTMLNGKIKVAHSDGSEGWKGVRAGMIQGQSANEPLLGANSHPVSSREPSSK